MRGKEKRIALILIVFLFAAGWMVSAFQVNTYQFPKVSQPVRGETTDLSEECIRAGADFISEELENVTGKTNYRHKELLVDDTFTSNLPLVVVDMGEETVKESTMWDDEKKCFVPIEGDPYVYGRISVINNLDGLNRLSDEVQTYSSCKLRVRGNNSVNYDKKQYLIKLIDHKGRPERRNVLGMGDGSEWVLNVSFIDKSLLRNYLAFITAGEIMYYTPDVQFCEVLWKDKDGYRYEGVYMMMESISVGKNRLDLPQYSENSSMTPALLRRDRYNVNGIMLENYATQKGLTYGYLDIEYPDKEVITQKGIQNITKRVDDLERALYADTWDEFIRYRNYIDMQSFVDYFILNEFFLNYDAGYNSTYMYMDYSGRLTMGPVWDFDQAVDNDWAGAANLQSTAFHAAPWFDRIVKDPVFTAALIDRYAQLRASILSDEAIASFLERTIEYLGPAIDRDWARWGYYYTDGNYLKEVGIDGEDKSTRTHEEEVEKIISVLSEHGAWLDEHLDSLYQFKMISLEDARALSIEEVKDYRPVLAIIFVAVFLISVKLVLRHESE